MKPRRLADPKEREAAAARAEQLRWWARRLYDAKAKFSPTEQLGLARLLSQLAREDQARAGRKPRERASLEKSLADWVGLEAAGGSR